MMDSDTSPSQAQLAGSRRLIDTLHRVTRFLGEVTDLSRLLTLVMAEAKGALDAEVSSCLLYEEASDELHFEVATGEKSEIVKTIRLKRGQGFAGICLAEGQTLLINDVHSDPRHDTRADEKSGFVTRNLIAVPMRHHGRMMGVLEAINKCGGAAFDAGDAEILEMMADQAALAIVNARLVETNIQRERMAAVGMAVSSVAHHLKNIILSVKAPVSLIRMGLEAKNEQITRESLDIIARASQRMEQSVGEMLTFGKERLPELEHGSLNDLVAEIARDSRDRAQTRGVELRVELDPVIQPSWIDRLRLHDAVLNLVGNAIEAHPDGHHGAAASGGSQTPAPWVALRTRLSREGSLHLIEVEDNGPGIPPDNLARIFQPFFSTKGSRGTGLGLAVVHKMAKENGGDVTVRSVVGQGTCFTLQLPVVAQHAPPVE